MTTDTITSDRSSWELKPKSAVHSSSDALDALNDATIAGLTSIGISLMTADQLVWVIRSARLPLLRSDTGENLQLHGRQTLERLVFLARRCCQNRTSAVPCRG